MKKPTRPSISIRGETYAQLKDHCERQQIRISEFTEELALEYLRRQQEKTPAKPAEERGVTVVHDAPHPNDVKW